jgi:hypothetical protein
MYLESKYFLLVMFYNGIFLITKTLIVFKTILYSFSHHMVVSVTALILQLLLSKSYKLPCLVFCFWVRVWFILFFDCAPL